jgi:hypothetical protein
LSWHKERLETFTSLVVGLFCGGNIQHHSLAQGFQSTVCLKSQCERIRRFFAEQVIDYQAFAQAMMNIISSSTPKVHLIIDRTNWRFGATDINYLVLAVRIGKITFPLMWEMLSHQGNSDSKLRIDLLERFRVLFGFQCVQSLTADREFVGEDWLHYLISHNIPFFIRIKENMTVSWGRNQQKGLKEFFSHLENDQERVLYKMIVDHDLTVVGKKLSSGEFLIVCSNIKDHKKILTTYKTRWSIETMFRNMKNQGFEMEKTHMKIMIRLMKLMAVVAVAVLISSLIGLILKCPFKKTVGFPVFSIFTRGLRWIRHHLKRPSNELFMLIERSFMSIF